MAKKVKRLADGGDVGGNGLKIKAADMKVGSIDGVAAPETRTEPKSTSGYSGPALGQANGLAQGLASGIQAGDAMNRADGRETFASKAKSAASSLKASLGMADGGRVGGGGRYYGKK